MGTVGQFFIFLAFVSAGLAAGGFWQAQTATPSQRGWWRIGCTALAAHIISVLAIFGVLLYLILTHQYQYHYVYSHSSNELPLHFVVSCLWEGQEGSFLLWMLWHSVLASIVWVSTPRDWQAGVLAIIASVEVILSSMVLGIYLPRTVVYTLLVAGHSLLVWYTWAGIRQELSSVPGFSLPYARLIATGAVIVVVLGTANLALAQTGWVSTSLGQPAFALQLAYILSFLGLSGWSYYKNWIPYRAFAPAFLVGLVALAYGWFELDGWKVGSTPFMLLREVRPDDPQFVLNPDFVPSNGNGLNPLLQNYWMVIHPPTLFLGFAATLIPFAFALTGLTQRRYAEWIQPAAPWAIFSVMILGVGILMGGYWAYETLNFGGYWNWDPVENASLVPWLTGVGALHGMLAWRKTRTHLTLTLTLCLATFLLVLYSTFLTRSGVLGDASVHSFTDLGLSGQLLLLLFAYVIGVVLVLVRYWNVLPADKPSEAVWTREFFLYLAAINLIFASIVLSFWTSLPVFNSLFGTNLAIKGSVPFHYYKWMVWFGIAIAVLSGIGQYYFWTKIETKSLSRALFRPFVFALVASMLSMGLLVYFKKTLIHNEALVEALKARKAEGTLAWLAGCVKYGLLLGADELLLTAALFTLAANVDIIRRLVSRGWVNLRHTGGALAHIGFGLMLLGILFSAGYEETVSVNPNPQSLGNSITEEKKRDNLLLRYNQSTQAKGYTVTYKGKVKATPPITNLTVLEADTRWGKVSFEDTKGYRYALFFPVEHFRIPGDTLFKPTRAGRPDPASFNLSKLKYFIETQLHISEPEMVNQRSIYQLEFVSTTNPDRKFMLYPEAESSGETGLISHPDREMTIGADLYTHVFGIPSEEKDAKQTWREVIPYVKVSPHDTFSVKGNVVTLEAVEQRKDIPGLDPKDLAIQARLKITTPAFQTYQTAPIYMLDHTNRSLLIESYVPEIGLRFAFTGALPQENKLIFQVIEKQPVEDYVIFNAIHKPGINLLWLGTFIMTAGFATALIRRLRE